MARGICLRVEGEYGCFSRPELKSEPVSYEVITPSAARGILEAIHWKPAICWVIDKIHVLRPIRFQSIRRNEVSSKISFDAIRNAYRRGDISDLQLIIDEIGKDGKPKYRQQRTASVLRRPAYLIEAHFELTDRAGPGDNEGKHADIFTRRALSGQCFAQPCLGFREFDARFELVDKDKPLPTALTENLNLTDEEKRQLGFAEGGRDLGYILWDIAHNQPDKPSQFFHAYLHEGVMAVLQPGDKEIRQ